MIHPMLEGSSSLTSSNLRTSMRRVAKAGLNFADKVCEGISHKLIAESPSLVGIALHSLCSSRGQSNDPALAANQNISVADFRALIETILQSGYAPVSPTQVAAGLDAGGKYVMLTFDDGYFNNMLALDVLREFRVPATFFICSGHVLEQKAFWWDALSRELRKVGADQDVFEAQLRRLKTMPPDRVESYLRAQFGPHALLPQSDTDRPFTPGELSYFARQEWVHLGNHTCDHAILTCCSREQMAQQIQRCQHELTELAGYTPIAIAYPNGNYSPEVIEAALAAGLRLGFTVRPHRNRLPLDGASNSMTLGRYYFLGDADAEFSRYRAGFIPSHVIKTLLKAA